MPSEYQRTVLKRELYSPTLASSRMLRIYLPPGYDPKRTYPAIYVQDGESFFNYGRIATSLTRFIVDGHCQPAIIIGVDVDLQRRTAEYSPEGSYHQAYVNFFATELVPWIQAEYPVRTQASDRILAGSSLGATVSLHLACTYPNLFCNLISLSGAFRQPTLDWCIAQPPLTWLHIYQLVGLDEQAVSTAQGTYDFLAENRAMKAIFAQQKASLHYEEKHGTHTWGFWQQHVPAALLHVLSSSCPSTSTSSHP